MKTIPLYRYYVKTDTFILVDDCDFDYLNQFRWHLNTVIGYVTSWIDGKNQYIHQIIMGKKPGMVLDHINGNKLDNRRCNLRFCTTKENVRNTKKSKNNTSGFNGVSYRKLRKDYRAYIMVDRKQINLGHYKTFDEALSARLKGEKLYFGEFAPNHEC